MVGEGGDGDGSAGEVFELSARDAELLAEAVEGAKFKRMESDA